MEDVESFKSKLLDAVSAFGGQVKYWNHLLSCFPPPFHRAASSQPATVQPGNTTLTDSPVPFVQIGELRKAKARREENCTPPTIQQCVAEDINGVRPSSWVASLRQSFPSLNKRLSVPQSCI